MMKIKNQLFLFLVMLVISCSVIKDHPKQVPPNQAGQYLLTFKIINDETTIDKVRNVCINISSYESWNQLGETGNYVIVHLLYSHISSGSLNQLLTYLDGTRGLRVIEIKPFVY